MASERQVREARPAERGGASPQRAAAPVVEPGLRQLVRVQQAVGNRAASLLLRTPLGPTLPPPTGLADAVVRASRPAFVFVMGEDRPGQPNHFYAAATRYWQAHLPQATFVTDKRSLSEVLTFVAGLSGPVGDLYIVSHANEDGTLSFGITPGGTDHHVGVAQLREALHPASGASALTQPTTQIDRITRIHIKGCDIGRTQGMLELIDEAFNGQATVDAPTHEQAYGFDPTLADRARAGFRADIASHYPQPPPVDASLRGRDRADAVAARRQALADRRRDIDAEIRSRQAEEARVVEEAGTYEAFSGPLFQRPGTQLFTAADLEPEVRRLYGHLSDRQRADLVRRLIAADQRTDAVALQQGTFQQTGQRLFRRRLNSEDFVEPRTPAEATLVFGNDFRQASFRPTAVRSQRIPVAGGFTTRTEIDGTVHERGQPAHPETMTFTSSGQPLSDDAALIASSRALLGNPDRYAWRVEERHAGGHTVRRAIAERVVAYLHHGSLDRAPHEHFDRPPGDPDFFATSTFAPPPPAPTP